MRVAVIVGDTLDAQVRHFIAAVRQAADLVGLVRVKRRPKKGSRMRRYARMTRETGLLRTASFLGGAVASALTRPRIRRRVEAALNAAMVDDPAAGVPVVDGGFVNSSEEVAAIRGLEPDLLYQAGPGITRRCVFEAAPRGMLHVHHGILPAIRGIASPEWAVREERPLWLGVTLHVIDAGLDTGPLVAQGRPLVAAGDTWPDVRAKLSLLGARLIAEGIRALGDGLEPVPQPPNLASAYRSNLGLCDWIRFHARLRRVLRACEALGEKLSVGKYLEQ